MNEVPKEQKSYKVRIGSKEVFMPKSFTIKDLKKAADISKDRSLILYERGKVYIPPDNYRVDVDDIDYFKDVPYIHVD